MYWDLECESVKRFKIWRHTVAIDGFMCVANALLPSA